MKVDNISLKKFGITMGIAFLVISALIIIRHGPKLTMQCMGALSSVFFITALSIPAALRTVYIFWMRFAFVLGWINTRLILAIMFYLVFTPIGICLRLFGKDLLDRKLENGKDSYWKKNENQNLNVANYERQF